MRAKSSVAFVALAACACVHAQDLSVTDIRQPVSGCALSAAENVTIRLFNYGSALPAATSFDVWYSVNAGAPVVEQVTLAAPLLPDSTFDYAFATQTNLSLPGTYTFSAGVALAGDIDPQNDAHDGYLVRNDLPSVGGNVAGPSDAVLDGAVTLSGRIGAVVEWQQSEDGQRWRRLANTTDTQAFALLRADTSFRALVRNGLCSPALSNAAAVRSSDPIFYSGYEP